MLHFQNAGEVQITERGLKVSDRVTQDRYECRLRLHNLVHDVTIKACVIAKDVGKCPIQQHYVNVFPVKPRRPVEGRQAAARKCHAQVPQVGEAV